MSDATLSNSWDAALTPMLHQAPRDRWASSVATVAVVVHLLSAVTLVGWNDYIVPYYKKLFEDFGFEISQATVFLIYQSDRVVIYWYALVPTLVAGLACDFLTTRWIAKQIGLRWACLGVACIAVVLLADVVVGKIVVDQEIIRLLVHIAHHVRPPKG